MKHMVTIGEAAILLGVCTKTIRRWDYFGKIRCFRTPGGHRRITLIEIERIKNGLQLESENTLPAIYCRVSSHEQKQKGDLQRQIEEVKLYCKQQGFSEPKVFQDVGSGLHTKRKGLQQLAQAIEKGLVNNVVITYQDRLTRFGFNYLEQYFASHGSIVQVINTKQECSLEEELVQDLIAIITSFSGRVHGLRSARAKQKRQQAVTKEQVSNA